MGNIYLVDAGNNRVRKINSAGIISTFAGTGVAGFSGDGSAATSAQLNNPTGLAADAAGNVYIVDTYGGRIRKVNTSGIISTFAGTGTGGYTGDGGAAINAQFGATGVAVDALGNVYIADHDNNCIRKVNAAGIISTIAGTSSYGISGDGGPAINAELANPSAVAVDSLGNVYISDYANNRVRKVNKFGIISTLTGTYTSGFSGDGGPAVNAELYGPEGLALDASGNLYIADKFNQRIRKVALATDVKELEIDNFNYSVYPNPTNGLFKIQSESFGHMNKDIEVKITNVLGEEIITKNLKEEKSDIDISTLNNGVYFLNLFQDNKLVTTRKLIKQ